MNGKPKDPVDPLPFLLNFVLFSGVNLRETRKLRARSKLFCRHLNLGIAVTKIEVPGSWRVIQMDRVSYRGFLQSVALHTSNQVIQSMQVLNLPIGNAGPRAELLPLLKARVHDLRQLHHPKIQNALGGGSYYISNEFSTWYPQVPTLSNRGGARLPFVQ